MLLMNSAPVPAAAASFGNAGEEGAPGGANPLAGRQDREPIKCIGLDVVRRSAGAGPPVKDLPGSGKDDIAAG